MTRERNEAFAGAASQGETVGSTEGATAVPSCPCKFGDLRPEGMIGSSPELMRLLKLSAISVCDEAPLLLFGESGTGKDLLAQAIHASSARASAPFVRLNMAAKPADLLDREIFGRASAHVAYLQVPRFLALSRDGTLYLDDVCRIPLEAQGRLIEFLRRPRIFSPEGAEIEWKGRIIAATNIDPRQAIHEGRFRRDLFDRLSVSYLHLPPLRQREGDIAAIAARLYPAALAEFGLPHRELPPRILAQMSALPWPGNARELVNVLRRMALTPEAVRGDGPELPPDIRSEGRAANLAGEALTFAEIERRAILAALERNNGSVPRASDELQLAASTIYRKLKSWNL